MSLLRQDGKRPDGTTILPWSRGKPLAWDVTVPDTYADAHVSNTAMKTGAAASLAATNQTNKYTATNPQLTSSLQWPLPLKQPVPGTTRLDQELGRRATIITGDASSYQWLCKRETNAVSFQNTFTAGWPVANQLFTLS